jgi:diguanylate cyclase (GGDEF)-like protein
LFYDITESKLFENKLADMATHDYLTGLPNRAILKDRFSVALARAKRSNSKFAAILCDIDNFKSINDTYGHMFGDRMLQAVASRLNGVMRAEEIGRAHV